jgi:hypothetical protein
MKRVIHRSLSVKRTVATVVLVIILGTTAGAAQPSGTVSEVVERIVNGNLTTDFPSAGALLTPNKPSTAGTTCSGTLIGCQTFLTAGHCVADDLDPGHYTVFLQNAGFFSVTSIALHPDFNFPIGDVAVLKLGTAVNGIRPAAINTTAAAAAGLAGTIVGFGRTGGSKQDYGIKRIGTVTTAACKDSVSGTTSVCWNFTNPLGAPGTNSNTCNGDSGGPLFIDFGTGPRIAGVTSGGTADTCLPTDNSYDANVFFYRSWIQEQAGADLGSTACGALPQVGDAETTVFSFTAQLSAASTQATHNFQVPAGTSVLRVTMNGVDDGSDFDLFVKASTPPSLSTYDCRQNGPGQFGFCEFVAPTAGTWYVLVAQSAGAGAYQVTTTAFSGGCADTANAGQACDDENPCTTNDRCQGGTCAGTAVTDGTACDDGNPCTQSDSCRTATCRGIEAPRTDCHQPFVTPSGLFRLQDATPGEPNAADTLTWEWWRGSATVKEEFGNPLSTTPYDLCVYDENAGTPALVMSAHIAANATCGSKGCWASTSTGFKYTDKKQQNGPMNSLVLKSGTDARAKITLKGKGTKLGIPALPLHEQNTVTVQLSNGLTCWQARYSDSTRNDTFEFNAKAN